MAKKNKKLPDWATTVTPLSKTIALGLFIFLPILAFYIGENYQTQIDSAYTKEAINAITQVKTNEPLPIPTFSPKSQIEGWKTYISKNYLFTFQYPQNWFTEDVPGYEMTETSFFYVGTTPDHGFGDHRGNELLTIEYSDDMRTLDDLNKTYYQNKGTIVTINGKQVLKSPYNEINIKLDKQRTISILLQNSVSNQYIDKILSSFAFAK